MEKKKAKVSIGVALKQVPSSVDAGSEFSLSAHVDWPESVPREGATFFVREDRRTIQEGGVPEASSDESGTLFVLRAPEEVGEHRLTLIVASTEQAGKSAEGTLPFAITTVPHATSLAVWDVPSPVVRNTPFEIKAGAKCTSACGLAGKVIEVRDENGELMGSGALGEAALPGTTALYFTTIELNASPTLALQSWTASFAPPELRLPHGGATSRFTFVTVAEPDHSVSVKVVNKETKKPVAGAQVRLGVYRAVTDETGTATVNVPKGKFPLVVTRPGYKMPKRNLAVAKDVRVRIAAEELPPEDPFALWSG